MRFMPCFLMTLGLMFALPAAGQAPEIKVVAAGSLTGAFNAMITDYGKTHPVHITTKWGPSGTLRDSLEHGEAFDIFASAALQHAQALTDKEISGPSVLFARNSLCAVVPATSTVTPDTLVDFLLKPETRLATSTPKADPAGDYTWQLFELIDHGRPGAYAALTGKAQQMAGGRLGSALNEGLADVVIAYCSSGRQAAAGGTSRMVPLPSDLAVGAEYGLTLSKHASPEASGFVMYMLSPKAQKMLKDFGFGPVTLPAGDL